MRRNRVTIEKKKHSNTRLLLSSGDCMLGKRQHLFENDMFGIHRIVVESSKLFEQKMK